LGDCWDGTLIGSDGSVYGLFGYLKVERCHQVAAGFG